MFQSYHIFLCLQYISVIYAENVAEKIKKGGKYPPLLLVRSPQNAKCVTTLPSLLRNTTSPDRGG